MRKLKRASDLLSEYCNKYSWTKDIEGQDLDQAIKGLTVAGCRYESCSKADSIDILFQTPEGKQLELAMIANYDLSGTNTKPFWITLSEVREIDQ